MADGDGTVLSESILSVTAPWADILKSKGYRFETKSFPKVQHRRLINDKGVIDEIDKIVFSTTQ